MTVRTRIAPSPTGYPHIGTIYQILFDYAFARKHNGQFIIRIEDTDRQRFVEDGEEKIYQSIDWFSLSEDESPRKGGPFSPYRQSERLDLYKKYALELIEKGNAYYCFCTKERLDEMRQKQSIAKELIKYDKHCLMLSKEAVEKNLSEQKPYVIRLNIPKDITITVKDEIRGDISFESNTVDDQVIIKGDGFPTYHLAVVVDDHAMEITHVVRGEEWLTSTPKHWLLYEYLGWEKPLFFHTPVLRNPDKSKLSKRHGHTNVVWYKEQGFLPEAILNFLALLGWSHPEAKEEFSLEEFTNLFDLKDIRAVAPIFDIKKLEWLNGEWIRKLPLEDLQKRVEDFYASNPSILHLLKNYSEDENQVLALAQTRMKTLADLEKLLSSSPINFSLEQKELARTLHEDLEKVEKSKWKTEFLLTLLKQSASDNQTNMKSIYTVIMGREQGLPLIDMMIIEGREKTLQKLRNIFI